MTCSDTTVNSVSLSLLADSDLVARAVAGAADAFSELVRRYYGRAYRVALGVVRDKELAEDVTQEAFVKAYTQLHGFTFGSAFYTWLYRIVFNMGIDNVRSRRRQRLTCAADETWFEAVSSAQELWPRFQNFNPQASVERGELRRRIRTAYDELPEIHRSVLSLREVEGHSYEEIATILGIKKGTVMSRLFHARRAMQNNLRRPEAEPVFCALTEALSAA